MTASLRQRTLSGMIWSSIQRFGSLGISFISSLVLARLLTPEDYGAIGVLTIFIALSNTFIDGGFGSALVQKKDPTQEDYSSIFYWNIVLAIILYCILFFLAPVISLFYKMPILSDVLRVQGIILLINALQIIQNNQLNKQLKFKPLSIINISASIVSVMVGIILAYCGFGVWSLVVQQLLNGIICAILLWIYNKWVPSFVFNLNSFKELFNFGGFMLLSNLLTTLCNNIQGLIIGRVFSVRDMGFYTKARGLEEIPSMSISNIVSQVTFPVFSELQEDKQKLKRALADIVTSLAFICFPLMVLLIVIAEPLIIFLFSDRWVESIPYFQILCVAGIAISLQGINYNVVAAIGKSKVLFKWTIIKRVIGLCCIFIGLLFGMNGLLWGMVVGSYIIYIVNVFVASKYIGYSLKNQFVDIFPILVLSAFVGMVTWFVGTCIHVNLLIVGLLQIIMFLSLYMILAFYIKCRAFDNSISTLKQIIKTVHERRK